MITGTAINLAKGHKPMLYEALQVIAGLSFKFTIVKVEGPNKRLNDLDLQNVQRKLQSNFTPFITHL